MYHVDGHGFVRGAPCGYLVEFDPEMLAVWEDRYYVIGSDDFRNLSAMFHEVGRFARVE